MGVEQQFINECSAAAVRLGIKMVVIAVRDPSTQEILIVGSPGAFEDLKAALAKRLGLVDPDAVETETGWPV